MTAFRRLPIKWARDFVKTHGLRQAIILAWDGERSHCLTYGVSEVDCDQAAQGGDRIKTALGWPHDPNCLPSRVKHLRDRLDAATPSGARIEELALTVVRRVTEYEDRTGPEDWPEALLITGDELKGEILEFARELLGRA